MSVMKCPQVASTKNSDLTRCINCSSLLHPEFRTLTTASLSQCTCTTWPCQARPHMMHAITTGTSSLGAIAMGAYDCGHLKCIQRWAHTAPQPKFPEASVKISWSGTESRKGRKIEIPFHDCRKRSHHAKSDRIPLFSRMWWWA